MQYRREIDGLRALAVLPVLFFHAGSETFSGGFVGVDVFFVISGYLISAILFAELSAERFSITAFYERRARRLLPALFFMMLVCVPVAWFTLLPADMKDFSESLMAVSVYGSNLLFWRETGYFDTASELKPLLHTWSLAVEEQYYLIFPLFLMMVWRRGWRVVMVSLALALLVSLALAEWATIHKPAAAFFLLPTRGWELLVGVFAGVLYVRAQSDSIPASLKSVGALVGLALILMAMMTYDKTTPFPGLYALIPTLGTALIIICASPNNVVGRCLGTPALVGIGLISYSAYLWHQPLFAFARHMTLEPPSPPVFWGLIGLTLVIAWLSWRFVEQPFRRREVISSQRFIRLAVMSTMMFLVLGGLGASGWLERYRFPEAGLAQLANVHQRSECAQDFDDTIPKPCELGDANGSRLIVAVGDSHLSQWGDVLDRIGQRNDIRVLLFSKSSCAMASVEYFYGTIKRVYVECTAWRSRVLEQIQLLKPDGVLLTNATAGYVQVDGSYPSVKDWHSGITDLIGKINQNTSQVLWLMDNPRFSVIDPFRCFQKQVFFQSVSDEHCHIPVERAFNHAAAEIERAVIRQQAGDLIDFSDFFCDAVTCRSVMDGRPLFRDTNHLSAYATDALESRLEAAIQGALEVEKKSGRKSIDG